MAVTSPTTFFEGVGGGWAAARARDTKIAHNFIHRLGDEQVTRVTAELSRKVKRWGHVPSWLLIRADHELVGDAGDALHFLRQFFGLGTLFFRPHLARQGDGALLDLYIDRQPA